MYTSVHKPYNLVSWHCPLLSEAMNYHKMMLVFHESRTRWRRYQCELSETEINAYFELPEPECWFSSAVIWSEPRHGEPLITKLVIFSWKLSLPIVWHTNTTLTYLYGYIWCNHPPVLSWISHPSNVAFKHWNQSGCLTPKTCHGERGRNACAKRKFRGMQSRRMRRPHLRLGCN